MNKVKYGSKAVTTSKLKRWPNPSQDRDYTISIHFSEFTCLCPRSGYPDFATIEIHYVPDKYIVELKSLKLYLNNYRSTAVSHEQSTNQIFDDLKKLLKPRHMEVTGDFNPRGNVKTVIKVSTDQEEH
ncbi:MAG: NADPH-dependent 7-cyano-7-deazaguanine reductase QueF [Nitrospiraceae bacterium]|nr:MAG: NADPH-dependent 7-cyano-7-deazaguanine reductase QueF [Nitrospiraceae bacterium]